MSIQKTEVSVALAQDFSAAQQAIARGNISAASTSQVSTLSNTVANNSYSIAGIKSLLTPAVATATVDYADTSVPLIGDLSFLKVYCFITSTSSCQIKVVPVDDVQIGAFRSISHCSNSSLDTMRHDLPFSAALNEAYSSHIFYQNGNYGTIDIDVLLTDETSVHLTVWFNVDTANTAYQLYVVEEART